MDIICYIFVYFGLFGTFKWYIGLSSNSLATSTSAIASASEIFDCGTRIKWCFGECLYVFFVYLFHFIPYHLSSIICVWICVWGVVRLFLLRCEFIVFLNSHQVFCSSPGFLFYFYLLYNAIFIH